MNKKKKKVLYFLIMLFALSATGCHNIDNDYPSPEISDSSPSPTPNIQVTPSEELPSTAEFKTPDETINIQLILENVDMKTALETLFNFEIKDINKIIAYLPQIDEERTIVNDEFTPKAYNNLVKLNQLTVDCYEIQELPEIVDNHYYNLYIDNKKTNIEVIAHIFNLYSNENHVLEMYGNEQYSTVYVHNDNLKYMLIVKNNNFSQFTIYFLTGSDSNLE